MEPWPNWNLIAILSLAFFVTGLLWPCKKE